MCGIVCGFARGGSLLRRRIPQSSSTTVARICFQLHKTTLKRGWRAFPPTRNCSAYIPETVPCQLIIIATVSRCGFVPAECDVDCWISPAHARRKSLLLLDLDARGHAAGAKPYTGPRGILRPDRIDWTRLAVVLQRCCPAVQMVTGLEAVFEQHIDRSGKGWWPWE